MNDSNIWNEIYSKTDYSPGWSKPGPDRNIIEIVKNILRNYSKKDLSVLDVGCGNGRNSLIFDDISKPVIHYSGIDFSDTAIEYCKKKYAKEKIFIKQNIAEPIRSSLKSFDLVIDCGCFHSILPEKRKIYIENIINITKKNTIYILGAWFKKDSNLDIITPRYFPYFSIDEWLFNQKDISALFAPYFTLKSKKIDKTIYPDINDGFIYFVLSRND